MQICTQTAIIPAINSFSRLTQNTFGTNRPCKKKDIKNKKSPKSGRENSEKGKNKTGVINDPLGQTHSLLSSEHWFCLKFVFFARFWKVGKDGRTDGQHMCENNDHYFGSGEWINNISGIQECSFVIKILLSGRNVGVSCLPLPYPSVVIQPSKIVTKFYNK